MHNIRDGVPALAAGNIHVRFEAEAGAAMVMRQLTARGPGRVDGPASCADAAQPPAIAVTSDMASPPALSGNAPTNCKLQLRLQCCDFYLQVVAPLWLEYRWPPCCVPPQFPQGKSPLPALAVPAHEECRTRCNSCLGRLAGRSTAVSRAADMRAAVEQRTRTLTCRTEHAAAVPCRLDPRWVCDARRVCGVGPAAARTGQARTGAGLRLVHAAAASRAPAIAGCRLGAA